MAKKKQIELTIEEKLQNALVPKEEQPYKIPNNWCWTRLENMEEYGIIIDDAKNDTREEAVISADNSRVKVLVVPTNEELVIAQDTVNILGL